MHPEVDEAIQVLLQKTRDCSKFICKAANESLGVMVASMTPARAMRALMARGIHDGNVVVRKCVAKHLLITVGRIGAKKLLSDRQESAELLVTMMKLAQDCNPGTRCYGQKMLNILMSHQKFDDIVKHSVPSQD
ncbi:Protein FAM179A, partial [Cuculus canorus]